MTTSRLLTVLIIQLAAHAIRIQNQHLSKTCNPIVIVDIVDNWV